MTKKKSRIKKWIWEYSRVTLIYSIALLVFNIAFILSLWSYILHEASSHQSSQIPCRGVSYDETWLKSVSFRVESLNTTSQDGMILVSDRRGRQICFVTVSNNSDAPPALVFQPENGPYALFITDNFRGVSTYPQLFLFDTTTGKADLIRQYDEHTDYGTTLPSWSADGRYVVYKDVDRTLFALSAANPVAGRVWLYDTRSGLSQLIYATRDYISTWAWYGDKTLLIEVTDTGSTPCGVSGTLIEFDITSGLTSKILVGQLA